MKNYVKERVADLDRDEVKAEQNKDLIKNKDKYYRLHWISHVSSLKTPKDMSDAMINMYEYDLENSTQECEGAM